VTTRKNLDIDRRIILKCILLVKLNADLGWIYVAQDRDQWRALVNTVRNLQVVQILGSSAVVEQLLNSKAGLGCIELVGYANRINIYSC
jgi:hypothetical protein